MTMILAFVGACVGLALLYGICTELEKIRRALECANNARAEREPLRVTVNGGEAFNPQGAYDYQCLVDDLRTAIPEWPR